MSRILVSAGCSFAFGANLHDREQRYSTTLAKHYGMELLDVSIPGASNEHIVGAACYGVQQALKRESAENIVLIVGWTDQSRMMYFNSKSNNIKTCYTAVKYHTLTEEQEELALFIRDNMWCEQAGYYNLIHAFSHVDNLCRAEGVKVIHLANLDLYHVMFVKKKLFPLNKHYKISLTTTDLVDILTPSQQERFEQLFTKESFWGMVRKNKEKWTVSPKDRHPNEDAHQEWAKRIMKDYDNILGTELWAS